MSIACAAPDQTLGVALRLATTLDCQSRAIGENGFQALAGGPAMASLLSGVVTIFVALIGYRFILGRTPGLRDGVSWALRLGFVLALVTSWPAFQTLVYDVTVDGPEQVAAAILPAAGLADEAIDARIQGAYDILRTGGLTADAGQATTQPPPSSGAQTQAPPGLPPMPAPTPQAGRGLIPLPETASLFVVSTIGIRAALGLVVGVLLAIAPLAILCLLFDGTIGILNGWVRALSGAAIGVLATTITGSVELQLVEAEIAHADAIQTGAAPLASFDPQGPVTVILVCALVSLVVAYAALRIAGAFSLSFASFDGRGGGSGAPAASARQGPGTPIPPLAVRRTGEVATATRSGQVAEALVAASHRDERLLAGTLSSTSSSRRIGIDTSQPLSSVPVMPLGAGGRRTAARRRVSAARRNRTG